MLCTLKFEGSVAIIGDDPDLPYDRPSLSKDYFSGEDFARIQLRLAGSWEERNVTMLLGRRVASVDPSEHSMTTDCGETIGYGKLVWAAGGSPRHLQIPGGDLHGVQGVRTKADAEIMKAASATARQIVIIGGDYIGLEAAAVLRNAGNKVVLLEALDRMLARVAGSELSRFYKKKHRSRGVDLRLGVRVEAIEGAGCATGVRLADGEVVSADHVIVGIGIIPAVDPLLAAGTDCENGVRVDRFCRTNLSDIYAIGDCAAHSNSFAQDAEIRLESVQNAVDQANVVARGTVIAIDCVNATRD